MPFHLTGTVRKQGEAGESAPSAIGTSCSTLVVSILGHTAEVEAVLSAVLRGAGDDRCKEGSLPNRTPLTRKLAVGRTRGPAGNPGRALGRGMDKAVFDMTRDPEVGCDVCAVTFAGALVSWGKGRTFFGDCGHNTAPFTFVGHGDEAAAAAMALETARADLCERFLLSRVGALSRGEVLEDVKPPVDGVLCDREMTAGLAGLPDGVTLSSTVPSDSPIGEKGRFAGEG